MSEGGPNTMTAEEQQQQTAGVATVALSLATTELEYRVDLLNKMVTSCYDRCAARPLKDGALSIGENSCIDRCCAKYWQVVATVGQLLGAGK